MEDEDQHKITDLVKELVLRLISQKSPSNPPNLNSPHFHNSLCYAICILSSRLTPSVSPDAADSIKRRLATQGKSFQALTFTDLYTKFASKTGPGSVNKKWAVLYLLKIISEDRNSSGNEQDSPPLLPNLDYIGSDLRNILRVSRDNGVLLVAKDPENLRDLAFREYVDLVKEENEVSQEVLVRDVLYACQGIDGSLVTLWFGKGSIPRSDLQSH